jgi:anti-anti-sigma regulatory factor
MRISARGNRLVETAAPGIRAMRFVRPDVRHYLDDDAATATSPLFREIQDTVLAGLPEGWTLIVNLGLIDPINAAFYRCLLDIRQAVQARRGRVVLCGLSPRHQEIFDLFRGPLVFTIVRTEAEACRLARRWRNDREPPRERAHSAPLPENPESASTAQRQTANPPVFW